jgi:perosamine synthetase
MRQLPSIHGRHNGDLIPISAPVLGEPEERLVLEVLRSGRLVQGPMVERFEQAISETVGTRQAVAVNNGTSALIVALLALDVGQGDEVITSPFTFVATLNSILSVGATPRFVDIGDDFNIDPELIPAAIGSATRAIMPVHLYGQPVAMDRLIEAVEGREVAIVEDAAQALGARVAGGSAGAFGLGCFSFYATKNITTGEGGALTTDDDGMADVLRVLRNQGQRGRYDYERQGFNFRMTELQGALGLAQMDRLTEVTEARRKNAAALSSLLEGIDGAVLPKESTGRHHVFHQYTLRVTPDARLSRNELAEHLVREGIGCGVYYPRLVFDYDCFRRDPRIGVPDVPAAARACREVLSLPVHPRLNETDIARISEVVREALT